MSNTDPTGQQPIISRIRGNRQQEYLATSKWSLVKR